MALNIGKLTGYTTSGAQIFQKMDKGTRVITTMAKDGKPLQEIRLKSVNNDIQGSMVKVRDFRTGLAREYSDLTDLKSDDKFRSVIKRFIDNIGNKIRIAVTKSKNGKKIEVAQNYEKANGEEFWLTKNIDKSKGNRVDVFDEFETSSWTKPNGEKLNGLYQREATIDGGGKPIYERTFGDIEALPSLKELI